MNPKLRATLAVVAGIAIANVVFIAFEWNSAYTPPADLDFTDTRAMEAWIASLPPSVFYKIIAGYIVGAFIGGWLTNWLSRRTQFRPALATGLVLFFASFYNLATIPHPEWFMWTSTISLVLFAWLGGKLVPKRSSML